MSGQTLSRSQRILALIVDWVIVLSGIFLGLSFIGIPGGLNIILIPLLVGVLIGIPVAYFKLLKWFVGTTLGRVVVVGLRRLYHRVRTDSEQKATSGPESTRIILCSHCQSEVGLSDKFCSECGKDLTGHSDLSPPARSSNTSREAPR